MPSPEICLISASHALEESKSPFLKNEITSRRRKFTLCMVDPDSSKIRIRLDRLLMCR